MASCEKEDFNDIANDNENLNVPLSRSDLDFNPLSELNGITFYVKNMGQGSAYLSADRISKGMTYVVLEEKDDGSGRQRWKFLQGGIGPLTHNVPINVTFKDGEYRPYLLFNSFGSTVSGFVSIENTSYYYYVGWMFVSGDTGLNPVDKTGYLQRESSGSNNLVYRKSNVADWAKWEIVPYGNYTIEDIEYIPYDGGSLDSTSVLVDTYTVDNTKSSVPLKRSRTVSTTVENTSTFSKTEGVTTTSSVSSDASVGLPEIGDILDFNSSSSISSSVTNTVSFSQGETTRKTKTISETYEVEVPAYTFYRLETFVKSYEINVKYIATLRNEGGTTFRVKGVWKGVQAVETYQKAYNQTTGKTEIVDSHSVE